MCQLLQGKVKNENILFLYFFFFLTFKTFIRSTLHGISKRNETKNVTFFISSFLFFCFWAFCAFLNIWVSFSVFCVASNACQVKLCLSVRISFFFISIFCCESEKGDSWGVRKNLYKKWILLENMFERNCIRKKFCSKIVQNMFNMMNFFWKLFAVQLVWK